MTFTVTEEVEHFTHDVPSVTFRTTAPFTPQANSLLVIGCTCRMGTGSRSITSVTNTHGLTFENLVNSGSSSTSIRLLAALVGASPSSGTVTANYSGTTSDGFIYIVSVPQSEVDFLGGSDAVDAFIQAQAGLTFGATTDPGSLLFAGEQCFQRGGAFDDPPFTNTFGPIGGSLNGGAWGYEDGHAVASLGFTVEALGSGGASAAAEIRGGAPAEAEAYWGIPLL
jgi:hypothetical protein